MAMSVAEALSTQSVIITLETEKHFYGGRGATNSSLNIMKFQRLKKINIFRFLSTVFDLSKPRPNKGRRFIASTILEINVNELLSAEDAALNDSNI